MYDDSKNPGQWEVVGGKTGNKTKSKSQSNKNTGNGTKSGGGGHVPILKVDELGKIEKILSYFSSVMNLLTLTPFSFDSDPIGHQVCTIGPPTSGPGKKRCVGSS